MSKTTHRQRVDAIRSFLSDNKLFLAMAAMVVLLLLSGNFFFKGKEESSATDEATQVQEDEELSWRFYPIDAVILLIGGGFCTIMIIRERHRAKEELK